MTTLPKRRTRGLRPFLSSAILAIPLLLAGCASGPKTDPVAEENARQRVLQQTISQLRLSLDEVRVQRDEVQEQYYKAETELDTAHRELAFLESRIRVERELGLARGSQLGDIQNQFLQTTAELRQAKDRLGKLEREQTTMRAAFDQDQLLVQQLEAEKATLTGEIESLRGKIAAGNEAWGLERRTLADELQAREDEIAVLAGKVAKSEATAREALASVPPKGTAVTPAAIADPATKGTGTTGAPVASHTADPGNASGTPAAGAAADEPLWKTKAKEVYAITATRFGTFIQDPAQNWRALAHPAPILFVFFAVVMPLVCFFSARRRLRRRSIRRHAAQVARAAEAAHVAAPPVSPSIAVRHPKAMPSVAIPRRREVIPTAGPAPTGAPARYVEPISPANAGSVAATLDAVLGGDPIATPAKRPAAPDDEDDLLGDLRDIVQKGLS